MKRPTVLAALALISCYPNTAPPPPPPELFAQGSFLLASINATSLPAMVEREGVLVVVTSGHLDFRYNRTYSARITAHVSATRADATVDETGTWSHKGDDALTLKSHERGCSDLAVFERRTLRMDRDCTYGWRLVYDPYPSF